MDVPELAAERVSLQEPPAQVECMVKYRGFKEVNRARLVDVGRPRQRDVLASRVVWQTRGSPTFVCPLPNAVLRDIHWGGER